MSQHSTPTIRRTRPMACRCIIETISNGLRYCFDVESISNQMNTLDIDSISTMCGYCFDIKSISNQMNALDIDEISTMCRYCFDIKSIQHRCARFDVETMSTRCRYRVDIKSASACRRYSMSRHRLQWVSTDKHMENLCEMVGYKQIRQTGCCFFPFCCPEGRTRGSCAFLRLSPGCARSATGTPTHCCASPEPQSAREALGVRGTCWAWAPA